MLRGGDRRSARHQPRHCQVHRVSRTRHARSYAQGAAMITPEEVDQTAARLRDALHAAADVMQVSPALAPPPAHAGRRVRRLPGWLIPLTAAACVVLIVAASVFAARHFAGTGPAPAPSTSRSEERRVG